MMRSLPPATLPEQMLIELSQWLARMLQYSPGHPTCAPLAERTHQTLTRALGQQSPLEFGVFKDDVLMGEDRAIQPAVKARVAPYLHERGILVLRFGHGVTRDELSSFVELLARTPQSIFEAGGLVRLAVERGISSITVEEIAHDITDEEREEHRRRRRLRGFFSEMLKRMLAERGIAFLAGDQLVELLDHPDIARAILEEDTRGIAEAVACLALLVKEESSRRGVDVVAKFLDVLSNLSPDARARVVLGFSPLVGEFRQAVSWAIEGFSDESLARFAFPSLRARPEELDAVLYALSVLVRHDGTRLSMMRRFALFLHDLPADEPATAQLLEVLARPVPSYDSFRRERECLVEHAQTALWSRLALRVSPSSSLPPGTAREPGLAGFDGAESVFELVKAATALGDFGSFAPRLASIAGDLASSGATDALIGILRGLGAVTAPAWQSVATGTIRGIANPSVAMRILEELERTSSVSEGEKLDEIAGVAKLLAAPCSTALFDWLERSESRKMRRILLDVLPLAGPTLLPTLKARLPGATWFFARNIVLLLSRMGGVPADVAVVARHPNEKVRLEVLRALRAMPQDSTSMDVLARYLVDASAEISRGARATLRGELLGAGAIAELARIAEDEQTSEELRRFSIQALGQCPVDAAAGCLFKVLQPKGLIELGSGSAAVRDLAAVALRGSPAPAARGYFEQGLASTVRRVRKACERAAGRS